MAKACKDVVSVAGPIISLLTAAAPVAKTFLDKPVKAPKLPEFKAPVLSETPKLPSLDDKALKKAAQVEMLRRKGGGRESTILSDKETLGG